MQELRQQLESHVRMIETMRSENRATVARHESVCFLSLYGCSFLDVNLLL